MKVFLSHSNSYRDDRELIQKITDELTRSGMEVWDDTREIYPGDNWALVTSQALEESQAMVVLLTPESIDSKWIKWSMGFALGNISYDHRLVPVLVGDPNRFSQENMPYSWVFKHLKVINVPDHGKNDENIKQIADAIKEAA
jgi:hypothetical protein